jgi:hypothetical protein
MCAKHPCDMSGEDSSNNQPTGPSCKPKQCCCLAQHDERYDAIFELLKEAEDHSERMELHAIENRKEAFEQAQKALESYNMLSEWILHAIVNIGGSNDTQG